MDRSLQEPLFKEISGYMSRDGDRTRLSDRELYHPTAAYSSDTVHEAGVSVRGHETVCETGVPDEKLEEYIVSWPGKRC